MHFLLDPHSYDPTDTGSIPTLLIQHLVIVGMSMGIAMVIALPLGVLIARRRRLYLPVITIAGFLYTIPGLALLAFLVPLTGLTTTTIIVPLVLYAQLVLIRNTVTAVNSVDPVLLEIGRAMGMNRAQVFWRITLPLALPIVVAGIRVATVTTIGIASLAALVGAGGLGDIIFSSIQNTNYDQVLGGGLVIGAVAVLADLALLGLQTALNRGRGPIATA
ncbi:MAG TPA: ABC transporter permease [bacterium]|nr:ABC transporter permease [bacterium]